MRVRVIAVGTRVPAWVRGACEDYLARLASRLATSLVEIEPGPRSAGGTAHSTIAAEGQRLLGAVRPGEHVAVLDERGAHRRGAALRGARGGLRGAQGPGQGARRA